jgi:group II intron reverse transcriptase/maturase
MRRIFEEKARPLPVTEQMVVSAYEKVRSKGGGAGIDNVSLSDYRLKLPDNLYKLWNRMSSGSYFPPAVKEHEIDKSDGKKRKLGIPTVEDRIAQQVIKDYLETRLENIFHENSYGYRPLRSAHQALSCVRENVRSYAWVIDLDIKSFFDTVSHEKLMLALDKHVEEKWVKMYIKRWLEAPIVRTDGSIINRSGEGTPQGGVISPLLANLYLHYTFDKWMDIHFPNLSFVRYADDIIIHCKTENQSHYVLDKVCERFKSCNLTVHPDKTKIVYCKDYRRPAIEGKETKFDFLGFSYRPVSKKSQRGGMFLGYDCEMSKKSYSKIVGEIRDTHFDRWAKSWADIATLLNEKIRGWIQYYDKYRRSTLTSVFHRFHNRLAKWIQNYYKKCKGSITRAYEHLRYIRRHYPTLFYHWEIGYPIV